MRAVNVNSKSTVIWFSHICNVICLCHSVAHNINRKTLNLTIVIRIPNRKYIPGLEILCKYKMYLKVEIALDGLIYQLKGGDFILEFIKNLKGVQKG